MPTAVNAPPPSLEAFDAVTTKNPKGSDRVIFKNGVLHTEGGGAALFHRVSTRKAAINALKQGVIQKCGQEFANIFSEMPGLKNVLKGTRSLRVSHVRDLMARVDAKAITPFLNSLQDIIYPPGEGALAPDPKVRSGLEQLVRSQARTLSPEDQDKLKGIGTQPEAERQNMVAELLEKMPCTLCLRAACGQRAHPDFHDIALPPQAHAPEGVNQPGLHTLDVATLGTFAASTGGNNGNARVIYALMAQNLPAMRKAQPEGLLTAQTVWQACFKEDAPPDLQHHVGSLVARMMAEVEARVAGAFGESRETLFNNLHGMNLMQALGAGLRYDVALKMAEALATKKPLPPITMESLAWRESLEKGMEGATLQSVEASVAGDIHRLNQSAPTYTFQKSGESIHCHPKDTTTLTDAERQNYRRGLISPKSREIMDLLPQVCTSEKQCITVGHSLNQNGAYYLRLFGGFYGAHQAEHLGMNVHISREREQGRPWEEWDTVAVRQALPLESKLEAHFEYVVDKNGKSTLCSLVIGEREQPKSSDITVPHEGLSRAGVNESIDALDCSDACKGMMRGLLESAAKPEKAYGFWGQGFAIAKAMDARSGDLRNAIPRRSEGEDKISQYRKLSDAWLPILDDIQPCLQAILETEWFKGTGVREWGADDRTDVYAAFASGLLGKHPELMQALGEADIPLEGIANFATSEGRKAPATMGRWAPLVTLFIVYNEMLNAEAAKA